MLIIPTPDEKVDLVVPTVKAVAEDTTDETEVTLTVTDSTSHTLYEGEVTVSDLHPYRVTIADFLLGLPWGQYVYTLSNGVEVYSTGIMQVGLTPAEIPAYNYEPEVIRYERDYEPPTD